MNKAAAEFGGLVDLVSEAIGGRVLGTNDEFFAGAENLVKPGRAVFHPDEYTDHGKWMDGWETRRRRSPGHDWCVLRLGASGVIAAIDIDTHHFVGNHAPFASLDGVYGVTDEAAAGGDVDWWPLLVQSPCRPDAQNLFVVSRTRPASHVRLNIFPDGGVARLRCYGTPQPPKDAVEIDEQTRAHHREGEVDLAGVVSGGRALCCSDAFFGPMNNLLLPGRAANMGGGWETRRSRLGGHDWIVIELGSRGVPTLVEIDTNHFKGNYPDRCSIEGIDMQGAAPTELIGSDAWRPIVPATSLEPHTRHFLRDAVAAAGPVSHIRLNIFPDGGVSRLRVWGRRDEA